MLQFLVCVSVLAISGVVFCTGLFFFFFKQKTAYEIGTGDWSSDVCSSDLGSVSALTVILC